MLRTVLLVSLLGSQCLAASRQHTKLIHDVLTAVESALKFFAEDYSSINVDGLFGLRLGQGQLIEAIRECQLRSCNEAILDRLKVLEKALNMVGDTALPYVEAEDPDYYNRFLATIDKPYVLPYVPTVFEDLQETERKIGSLSQYDEDRGDACYARMLGTYKENEVHLPKCNTTHDCWDYMTKEDTSGYFITHQLLYFIVIEHVGCRESVENFIQGDSLFEVQKRMCGMIYHEARRLSAKGTVSRHRRDLFLEQTVLCGPLGFEDFMRPDWMDMVLQWPDKRLGCFKWDLVERLLSMPVDENTRDLSSNVGSMRKLMREKPMKDGCLSHTSGLGFGVMNTYLRFLLRYL